MATIRIPFADTAIATPNPGAGQVRADLRPALRDPRAGQMDPQTGSRSITAGNVDPGAMAAPGTALMRSAGALDQLAEREQQMADQVAIRQANTALDGAARSFEETATQGPVRPRGDVVADFRRHMTEAAATVGRDISPRSRDMFNANMEAFVEARAFTVGREAFQRQSQAAVASLQDGTRETANAAAQARNPAERALLLQRGEADIQAAVEAGYLNPEAAGRLRRGFNQDVEMADVNRLMATDPSAAIRLLNDPGRTPHIEADRRQVLINNALTRRDAMAARGEAAAARAEARTARAVGEFNGLLAAGIVPEGRAETVLAMARGTPLEPQVRQMIADARGVSAFALASAQDQEKLLAEAQGRVRAPNATDADLAHFQRLQGVREAQLRGYQQDGLGRAVQEGIVPPQPPIDWTRPDSLNGRVEAAAGVSARRGYAISPFNREDLAQAVQQFTAGNPDQRLAIVQAVTGINDPQVRAAAVQHLERARGDAGRLPPGTLVRVADMLRSGTPEGVTAARRLIGALGADVSDRARSAGESAEMRAALESAQSSGVQGVRVRAAAVAGGGPFAALVNRDMDVIRRAASEGMASGEANASRAVREAQRQWNAELATVDDPSLAHVYFPAARANPAQVTAGLRALRDAAAVVPADPAQGGEANLAARQRAAAARTAVWINEGPNFSLVARGAAGAPVVLRQATLDEVTGTARRQEAERPAVAPPRPPGQQRQGRMLPTREPEVQ